MTIQEAMEARHSVRAYKDQPLSEEIVKVLEDEIVKLNHEGQMDLGIAKYHFEVGAGKVNFEWV